MKSALLGKWASLEFLNQNNVAPWSDMPAWLPDTGEDAGFARVDISKALKAGLEFRLLEDTVRDTLKWAKEYPVEPGGLTGGGKAPPEAGLGCSREKGREKRVDTGSPVGANRRRGNPVR